MVAYSFKKHFAAPILAGTKRQTLRNDRKRHARAGETLQLYTGMRTKHCQLVGTATCLGVTRIRLDFEEGRVESFETGLAVTRLEDLDAFAQFDGFTDWRALERFWRKEHPDVTEAWEGVRIQWIDFKLAAELGSPANRENGNG